MRCKPAILFFACLGMSGTISQAGIVGTTGSVSLVAPPGDVRAGNLESDSLIIAFAERQAVVLPQDLSFNITLPGTSPGDLSISTSPGDIAAGTMVNSYFIHFDSVSGTFAAPVVASGSVTFHTDVLGIAVFNRRLNESDPILGLAQTLYPTGQDRELDINAGGIVGVGANDQISLSADRRTVTFAFGNSEGIDQLRVVTAVPEASSLALAGVGATCLAAWRARRRREMWAVNRRLPTPTRDCQSPGSAAPAKRAILRRSA